MKSFILELHNQIINGDKTISDIVRNSIQKCKNINDTNSLVTDTYSAAEQQAKILENDIKNNQNNLLYGIPYILKDNVCTKGIKTTGGSAFLSNFIPPYSATIYDLFNQDNAVLIGKSNMDEFGMGGAGIYSAYGITKNILDPTRITGGSSSGSVNLVAAGVVPFAIGTDTGDSSRRPASLVGIVGFKPTYGLISRYGIMPYAPSMDHVGILTKTVSDVAIVADYLFKYDEKDFTSQRLPANNLFNNLTTVDKLTIGVIKDVEKYLKPDILKAYIECIELLKKNNYIVKYLDFNDQLLASVHAVYYAISYSEANSC
jgi:aspartyl-tRNA(Asn)/glutamyl-tRNA(Gln) amidotransferase subunit A